MELRVEIQCSLAKRSWIVVRAEQEVDRADRADAAKPDGKLRVLFAYSNERSYVDTRERLIGSKGEGGTTDQGVSFMRYQKRVHIGGKIFERDSMCEVLVLQRKCFLTNLVIDLA